MAAKKRPGVPFDGSEGLRPGSGALDWGVPPWVVAEDTPEGFEGGTDGRQDGVDGRHPLFFEAPTVGFEQREHDGIERVEDPNLEATKPPGRCRSVLPFPQEPKEALIDELSARKGGGGVAYSRRECWSDQREPTSRGTTNDGFGALFTVGWDLSDGILKCGLGREKRRIDRDVGRFAHCVNPRNFVDTYPNRDPFRSVARQEMELLDHSPMPGNKTA
jgi:hypothetical protein